MDKIKNSRGAEEYFKFGHYLERGGKGRILQSVISQTEIGKEFLSINNNIWKILTDIAQTMDPEYAKNIKQIPEQYRTIGIFSMFVSNIKPPTKVHRDCKDYRWCLIFLYGKHCNGLYLHYLNTYIVLQLGDVLMLDSKRIWHQADKSNMVDRYSGIVTTHAGLCKRFNKNN